VPVRRLVNLFAAAAELLGKLCRTPAERKPLPALHPNTDNDDYRVVTFLDEATRQKEMIDAAQRAFSSGLLAAAAVGPGTPEAPIDRVRPPRSILVEFHPP